jgi:hypothetical protein
MADPRPHVGRCNVPIRRPKSDIADIEDVGLHLLQDFKRTAYSLQGGSTAPSAQQAADPLFVEIQKPLELFAS